MAKKLISDKEKKELLSIPQDKLSMPLISKLFGKTTTKSADGKFQINEPKYNVRDLMHLDANEYINKEPVDTTVGSFLFNKLMIEGMLEDIIPNGYYNEVIDKKGFGKLINYISEAIMLQKLPINPTLIKWLKQYEFYGMKACTIFSPSYTEALLRQDPRIQKEKEKILKSSKIETPQDMANVEDTIVDKAKTTLKDDKGMTLFDSGARGSFDNDYKNMNLMLGPVAVPGSNGKFDLVTSNYIDGLQKEDLIAAGNSVVNSAYPKAVSCHAA
jgi:hypothetical protein